MSSRTSGNLTVILILLTGVQAQHSVTLSSQSLCAVTGSTVKISCKYTKPDSSRVREREWYQLQNSAGEERVLSKDPQYSARVSLSSDQNNCELTVRHVTMRDSGVYNFRFRTSSSDWISASSGVNLTVTELQVKVDRKTAGKVKLTCSSTCSSSEKLHYRWYRNGEYKTSTEDSSILIDTTRPSDEGSYYCKMSGSWRHSPPVCVSADSSQKICWSVTFDPTAICAVTGSSVHILCYYTFPDNQKVTKSVWFIKEWAGAESVDVREDEEHQGRVQYIQSSQNDCSMRITDLRESDAQTYRFRFYTDGGEYTGEAGVTLSVTGRELQVKVDRKTAGKVKLTCSSTCSPSDKLHYIWYRNGEYKTSTEDSSILIDTTRPSDEGSYSCQMSGSLHRSPPVYVLGRECCDVSYTPERVCALKGSSVDLSCSYNPGGHTVTKSVWFIEERAGAEAVDVREDEKYQGRVQYIQSSQNDCSMRITHLRESDAQTYRFRFHTDGGEYTGEAGVTLSVTDLKVTVSDTDSGGKRLNCSSTCSLSIYKTYIWYKNEQPLSDQYKTSTGQYLSVDIVGADNYSCSVSGHEELRSPAVYSPRNTRAVIVSSGETVEGDSVTLSCSSDANPPVLTYSWFNQRAAADTPLTTDQNYTITTISSQHSGLYYCTAYSQLGQHSSTPTRLDVLHTDTDTETDNTAVKLTASAVGVLLILMLFAACLWTRRKRGAARNTDIQTPDPADPSYIALNPTTMSSDYDTLQYRTDSPSDTYTALNPETMCSDCDTLTHRTESPSDTYTALNPETMCSDYDALTHPTESPSDTYTALNPETMCSDYDALTHPTESPSDTYTALNPETMCSDYDALTVVCPHREIRSAPEKNNEKV